MGYGPSADFVTLSADFVTLSADCVTLSADFVTLFGSIDYLDSIDSIESADSIDIIDSIDSILVPHKETANIHTTHKGRTKVPMGAWPPSVLLFARAQRARPFVCGVNVGGLFVWHKYRIYRIYDIYRVCRFYRIYRI